VQAFYGEPEINQAIASEEGMDMDEEPDSVTNVNNLYKCPHCNCCFCSDVDLQKHIKSYGNSKAEHIEEFRKVHGRLEHGSFNGPE
jgi:hypothetical protein